MAQVDSLNYSTFSISESFGTFMYLQRNEKIGKVPIPLEAEISCCVFHMFKEMRKVNPNPLGDVFLCQEMKCTWS